MDLEPIGIPVTNMGIIIHFKCPTCREEYAHAVLDPDTWDWFYVDECLGCGKEL